MFLQMLARCLHPGLGSTARPREDARKMSVHRLAHLLSSASAWALCSEVFSCVCFPWITGNYYLKCKEHRMLTDFLKNSKNETECNDLHGTGQYTAWDRTARGEWRPARLRGVHACAGSRYHGCERQASYPRGSVCVFRLGRKSSTLKQASSDST